MDHIKTEELYVDFNTWNPLKLRIYVDINTDHIETVCDVCYMWCMCVYVSVCMSVCVRACVSHVSKCHW